MRGARSTSAEMDHLLALLLSRGLMIVDDGRWLAVATAYRPLLCETRSLSAEPGVVEETIEA